MTNLRRRHDPIGAVACGVAAFLIAWRFLEAPYAALLALGVFGVVLLAGGHSALDLLLDVIGAAAWALAALVLGARFISPAAGGLLALAVFSSVGAMALSTHLQETRMKRLSAGVCPHCRGAIAMQHRHRRWEAARAAWLAPLTSWECASCCFSHGEPWPCPTCPEPQ